jgi:hypothetical protein
MEGLRQGIVPLLPRKVQDEGATVGAVGTASRRIAGKMTKSVLFTFPEF